MISEHGRTQIFSKINVEIEHINSSQLNKSRQYQSLKNKFARRKGMDTIDEYI